MKDKTKDIINSIFTKTMFSISLLTLIFLFCLNLCPMVLVGAFHLVGSGISGEGGGDCDDSSCAGFLVCQNFEGAGYDNGETWSEQNNGTVDEDYTTNVGRGSQSLRVIGSGGSSSSFAKITFTASGEVYGHVMVRFDDATPSSARGFLYMRNSSDSTIYELVLRTDGAIRVYNGTSYLTSSPVFSDATWYHVWFRFSKGSGNNGIYQVWVGESTTKPELTINGSNGTSTTDAADLHLNEYGAVTTATMFDQILLSTSDIGDICD